MARVVRCPRCQHELHVDAEIQGRWITCPRCLSSIALTEVNQQIQAPVPATPAPVAALAGAERSCRRCGYPLQAGWRSCPHCGARQRPPGMRPIAHPDTEARTDMTVTGACLATLAILLVLGFVFFASTFGGDPELGRFVASDPTASSVMVLGGGLLVLILAGSVALILTSKESSTKMLATVIGTPGLVAGGLFLAVVLFVCMVIFAFQQCLNGCTNLGK